MLENERVNKSHLKTSNGLPADLANVTDRAALRKLIVGAGGRKQLFLDFCFTLPHRKVSVLKHFHGPL